MDFNASINIAVDARNAKRSVDGVVSSLDSLISSTERMDSKLLKLNNSFSKTSSYASTASSELSKLGKTYSRTSEMAGKASLRVDKLSKNLSSSVSDVKSTAEAFAAFNKVLSRTGKMKPLKLETSGMKKSVDDLITAIKPLAGALNRATTAALKNDDAIKSLTETYRSYATALRKASSAQDKISKSNKDSSKSANQLNDRLSALETRQRSTNKTISETRTVTSQTTKSFSGMTGRAGLLGAAIGTLVGGFTALKAVMSTGIEFEAQMSKVQAITGATKEDLEELTAAAREMGATTQFSATESAQALEFMGLAGFTADQAIKALPHTLSLAAASGMDLASTADIVTNQMTALQMSVEELPQVVDHFAAVTTTSNTNMRQLADSAKYAAPIFAEAGYNISTMTASIGMMANIGIQGTMSGTALRGAISRLAKPPKMAADSLKELGISAKDANNDMKPLGDVMQELSEKFKGMGNAVRLGHIKTIFGMEAMTGMSGLITQSETFSKKVLEGQANIENFSKAMSGLASPSEKARAELHSLGVVLADNKGKATSSQERFNQLAHSLKDLNADKQAASLKKIFGDDIPASIAKTIESTELLSGELTIQDGVVVKTTTKFKDYEKQLNSMTGTANRMAKIMSDNVKGAIKTMNSSFESLALTSFDFMKDDLRDVVDWITNGVRAADDFLKSIQEWNSEGFTASGEYDEFFTRIQRGWDNVLYLFYDVRNSFTDFINEMNDGQTNFMSVTDTIISGWEMLGGFLNNLPNVISDISTELHGADNAASGFIDSMFEGRTLSEVFSDAITELAHFDTMLDSTKAIFADLANSAWERLSAVFQKIPAQAGIAWEKVKQYGEYSFLKLQASFTEHAIVPIGKGILSLQGSFAKVQAFAGNVSNKIKSAFLSGFQVIIKALMSVTDEAGAIASKLDNIAGTNTAAAFSGMRDSLGGVNLALVKGKANLTDYDAQLRVNLSTIEGEKAALNASAKAAHDHADSVLNSKNANIKAYESEINAIDERADASIKASEAVAMAAIKEHDAAKEQTRLNVEMNKSKSDAVREGKKFNAEKEREAEATARAQKAKKAESDATGALANAANDASNATDKLAKSNSKMSKSAKVAVSDIDKLINGLQKQADLAGLTAEQKLSVKIEQAGIKSGLSPSEIEEQKVKALGLRKEAQSKKELASIRKMQKEHEKNVKYSMLSEKEAAKQKWIDKKSVTGENDKQLALMYDQIHAQEELNKATKENREEWKRIGESVQSSIGDILTGAKSTKDAFKDIGKMFADMATKKAMEGLFGDPAKGGGLGNMFANLFGGGGERKESSGDGFWSNISDNFGSLMSGKDKDGEKVDIFGGIKDMFTGGKEAPSEGFFDSVTNLFTGGKKQSGGFFESISNMFSGDGKGGGIFDSIGKMFSGDSKGGGIMDTISGFFGGDKDGGGIMDTISGFFSSDSGGGDGIMSSIGKMFSSGGDAGGAGGGMGGVGASVMAGISGLASGDNQAAASGILGAAGGAIGGPAGQMIGQFLGSKLVGNWVEEARHLTASITDFSGVFKTKIIEVNKGWATGGKRTKYEDVDDAENKKLQAMLENVVTILSNTGKRINKTLTEDFKFSGAIDVVHEDTGTFEEQFASMQARMIKAAVAGMNIAGVDRNIGDVMFENVNEMMLSARDGVYDAAFQAELWRPGQTDKTDALGGSIREGVNELINSTDFSDMSFEETQALLSAHITEAMGAENINVPQSSFDNMATQLAEQIESGMKWLASTDGFIDPDADFLMNIKDLVHQYDLGLGWEAGATPEELNSLIAGMIDMRDSFKVFGYETKFVTKSLMDAFGDVETLSANMQSFQTNFLSETQQNAGKYKVLNDSVTRSFHDLGMQVPRTRSQFKMLIDGLADDLDNQENQEKFAALMGMSDELAQLYELQTKGIEKASDAIEVFASKMEGAWRTISSADIGSMLTDSIMNAANAQEAGKAFADNFAQMFQQKMVDTVITTVSDMVFNSIITPMISATTNTVSMETTAAANAANMETTASINSANMGTTSAATASGMLASGGQIAAGYLTGIVEQVKNTINVMGQVINNPEIQELMGQIMPAMQDIGAATYTAVQPVMQRAQLGQYAPDKQKDADNKDKKDADKPYDFSDFIKELKEFNEEGSESYKAIKTFRDAFKGVDSEFFDASMSSSEVAASFAGLSTESLPALSEQTAVTADDIWKISSSQMLALSGVMGKNWTEIIDLSDDAFAELLNKNDISMEQIASVGDISKMSESQMAELAKKAGLSEEEFEKMTIAYVNSLKEQEDAIKSLNMELQDFVSGIGDDAANIRDIRDGWSGADLSMVDFDGGSIKVANDFLTMGEEGWKRLAAQTKQSVPEVQEQIMGIVASMQNEEKARESYLDSLISFTDGLTDTQRKADELAWMANMGLSKNSEEAAKQLMGLSEDGLKKLSLQTGISVEDLRVAGVDYVSNLKEQEDALKSFNDSVDSFKGGLKVDLSGDKDYTSTYKSLTEKYKDIGIDFEEWAKGSSSIDIANTFLDLDFNELAKNLQLTDAQKAELIADSDAMYQARKAQEAEAAADTQKAIDKVFGNMEEAFSRLKGLSDSIANDITQRTETAEDRQKKLGELEREIFGKRDDAMYKDNEQVEELIGKQEQYYELIGQVEADKIAAIKEEYEESKKGLEELKKKWEDALKAGEKAAETITGFIDNINKELGVDLEQNADQLRDALNKALPEDAPEIAEKLAKAMDYSRKREIENLQELNKQQTELQKLRDGIAKTMEKETNTAKELMDVLASGFSDSMELSDDNIAYANDYKSAIESAMSEAIKNEEDVQKLQQEKYNAEVQRQENLIEFAQELNGFIDDLALDDALSPLTTMEKFAESQKQYESTLQKARAGDVDAQKELTGAAKAYLELAGEAYASSSDYVGIFEQVKGDVKETGGAALQEASAIDVQSLSEEEQTAQNTAAIAEVQQEYLDKLNQIDSVTAGWQQEIATQLGAPNATPLPEDQLQLQIDAINNAYKEDFMALNEQVTSNLIPVLRGAYDIALAESEKSFDDTEFAQRIAEIEGESLAKLGALGEDIKVLDDTLKNTLDLHMQELILQLPANLRTEVGDRLSNVMQTDVVGALNAVGNAVGSINFSVDSEGNVSGGASYSGYQNKTKAPTIQEKISAVTSGYDVNAGSTTKSKEMSRSDLWKMRGHAVDESVTESTKNAEYQTQEQLFNEKMAQRHEVATKLESLGVRHDVYVPDELEIMKKVAPLLFAETGVQTSVSDISDEAVSSMIEKTPDEMVAGFKEQIESLSWRADSMNFAVTPPDQGVKGELEYQISKIKTAMDYFNFDYSGGQYKKSEKETFDNMGGFGSISANRYGLAKGIISEDDILSASISGMDSARMLQLSTQAGMYQGDVTAFATGGIVTQPTMGLIGEAGENEAVIPLSKFDNFSARSEELYELRQLLVRQSNSGQNSEELAILREQLELMRQNLAANQEVIAMQQEIINTLDKQTDETIGVIRKSQPKQGRRASS